MARAAPEPLQVIYSTKTLLNVSRDPRLHHQLRKPTRRESSCTLPQKTGVHSVASALDMAVSIPPPPHPPRGHIYGGFESFLAEMPRVLCSLTESTFVVAACIGSCYVHSALAARWPTLHRMSPWFDEAYLALSVLVEARFLANNSCLLSESFYGLRRCRYGPRKGPPGEFLRFGPFLVRFVALIRMH